MKRLLSAGTIALALFAPSVGAQERLFNASVSVIPHQSPACKRLNDCDKYSPAVAGRTVADLPLVRKNGFERWLTINECSLDGNCGGVIITEATFLVPEAEWR